MHQGRAHDTNTNKERDRQQADEQPIVFPQRQELFAAPRCIVPRQPRQHQERQRDEDLIGWVYKDVIARSSAIPCTERAPATSQ